MKILPFAVIFAGFLSVLLISGCTRGMPPGYCDPGGPGPVYNFQDEWGRCVLRSETRCNAMGEVNDNCLKYSKAEKKEAFSNYLLNQPNGSFLGQFKDTDVCIFCSNVSSCPVPLHGLVNTIC